MILKSKEKYLRKRNICIQLLPTCTFIYSLLSCLITFLNYNQFSTCTDFDRGSTFFKQTISILCFSFPIIFLPYFIYFFRCIPLKPIVAFSIDICCFIGWILSIVSILTIIFIQIIVPTNLNQIDLNERIEKERKYECCYAYTIYKEFRISENRFGGEYEVSCQCPLLQTYSFENENEKIDSLPHSNEKCKMKMEKDLICCNGNILSSDLFWMHLLVLVPVSISSGFISLYGLYNLNKQYQFLKRFKNLFEYKNIDSISNEYTMSLNSTTYKNIDENENKRNINLHYDVDYDLESYTEIELL